MVEMSVLLLKLIQTGNPGSDDEALLYISKNYFNLFLKSVPSSHTDFFIPHFLRGIIQQGLEKNSIRRIRFRILNYNIAVFPRSLEQFKRWANVKY